MKEKRLIEICCCSVDDAIMAQQGGANRIELNSALECGGLTPSLGALIETRKRISIPIITMIRPRTGGFCYTDLEFETMIQDSRTMLENGADGIAVGILCSDKSIDINRTKVLVDICKSYDKEIVFHRAIDIAKDITQSVNSLIELEINRVLTSGGSQRCLDGIDNINKLFELFGYKIEILVCGSIRPTNIEEIIKATNCSQFHMALMKEIDDQSMISSNIKFNGIPSENTYKVIDREEVKKTMQLVGAK